MTRSEIVCRIAGCTKFQVGRGLCRKHYGRWWTHGDPEGGGTAKGALTQWIRNHASHEGAECLTWPFARGRDGTGRCKLNGKNMNAHRAMCLVAHGEPPSSDHVTAHSCGRAHEGCVNPAHLRWATKAENQADRLIHGTDARGQRNPMCALTEDKVRAIRQAQGTHKSVAVEFGISRQQVANIRSGKAWGWLPNG